MRTIKIVGILILVASSYYFPKVMLAIAATYGILFVVFAVWFVGGMLKIGIRETNQTRRKQSCG